MSGKPSLAAALLASIPSLHALIPADTPEWIPVTFDGGCDECDGKAAWLGPQLNYACDSCRRKAEAR